MTNNFDVYIAKKGNSYYFGKGSKRSIISQFLKKTIEEQPLKIYEGVTKSQLKKIEEAVIQLNEGKEVNLENLLTHQLS